MKLSGVVLCAHKDDGLPQLLTVGQDHIFQHFLLAVTWWAYHPALLDDIQTQLLLLQKHLQSDAQSFLRSGKPEMVSMTTCIITTCIITTIHHVC